MWKRKPCGCVKSYFRNSNLAVARLFIRCDRHRNRLRLPWRSYAYFDQDGIVRRA